MKRIVLLILIFVLTSSIYYFYLSYSVDVVSSDSGTTYYVANDGDDSNSGTSTAAPWKSINKVNTALDDGTINVGDDIYFKRGDIWQEDLGTGRTSGLNLKLGGTVNNWMIIGAYGSGAKPILNNTNTNGGGTTGTGTHVIVCNSEGIGYITIQDIETQSTYNEDSYAEIYWTDDKDHYHDVIIRRVTVNGAGQHGIFLFSVENYTIENCIVHNSPGVGIRIQGSKGDKTHIANGTIRNCTVYNTGKDGISFHYYDDETIGRLGNNHWVENCTIYDAGGSEESIDLSPGDSSNYLVENCIFRHNANLNIGHAISNVVLQNNYFYNYSDHMITFGKSNNTIIRNTILQNCTTGKHVFVEDGSTPSENITLYNCNIITLGNSHIIQINYPSTDTFIVKNNIFYSTQDSSPGVFVNLFPPLVFSDINSEWSHNIWWRGDGGVGDDKWWSDADGSYNLNQWILKSEVSNDMRVDPLLTDAINGDFSLQKYSPAIDAGDFLTTTVGSGSGIHITVEEANYFFSGISSLNVNGDNIVVGSNSNLEVIDVNYSNETIKVNRTIDWNDRDPVTLVFSGSAPDIGAYEFSFTGLNNTLPKSGN